MSTIPDERLALIFTCCHPALAVDAQVALTLRLLVLLEDQDRWLWDEDEIAEGRALVETALRRREPSGSATGRSPAARYRHFHSARADLLRRLGREEEARAAYERALALAPTGAEREFLERRLVSPE